MAKPGKTLNLEFGADVESIGALLSPTFRDTDGRAHEFKALAPNTPNLPTLLSTGMSLIQSRNSRTFSRKNTNKTIHASLTRFLAWANAFPANALSPEGMTGYRNHLYDSQAASSAYNLYTVLARTCTALMEAGHISKFTIPANASRTQVVASTPNAGASFARSFEGTRHEGGADEANESIMKTWLDASWTELDALFGRIRQGREWRSEAETEWDIPRELRYYLHLIWLDRSQALSLCKSISIEHLGGEAPKSLRLSKSDLTPSWTRSIQAIATKFASSIETNITAAELGAAISNPSIATVSIPEWAADPVLKYSGDKEEHIKIIVQCLHKEFSCFPFHSSISLNFPGLPRSRWLDAIRYLYTHAYTAGHKVYVPEIAACFHPSPAMAGLSMSILCAAQINPTSAMHLKISDLVDDPSHPGQSRLMWEKGRAGGPQAALPFPKGSPKSRTIPRLWERLTDATSELRALAPPEARHNLSLWTTGNTGDSWLCYTREEGGMGTLWNTVREYLEGTLLSAKPDPKTVAILAPIAAHIPKISLALIRNTAINISSARLDRDFKATSAMDGRKSISSLENSYLANSQTKDRLDKQIREGQEALAQWLRTPPVVVQDDASAVMRTLSVDEETARKLLSEELNNGMGASLLNQQAIFIDTPLNALRIIQWLDRLEEARPALLRDNPLRWNALYQPQVGLYKEALHSFSRASVSEARKLNKKLELPFPPIH